MDYFVPHKHQKSLIYKITSPSTNDIYIGSTINLLCLRKTLHKYHYKLYLENRFNYIKAFDIIKYFDWKIEIIEYYPVNSIKKLHQREGWFIKNTPNCINNRVAGRTNKEYQLENRQLINQRARERYQQKIKSS